MKHNPLEIILQHINETYSSATQIYNGLKQSFNEESQNAPTLQSLNNNQINDNAVDLDKIPKVAQVINNEHAVQLKNDDNIPTIRIPEIKEIKLEEMKNNNSSAGLRI